MEKKVIRIIIAIIIITIILGVTILIINFTNKEHEQNNINISKQIELDNNVNDYLHINNYIYLYLNYSVQEFNEALYNILDKEYINNNGINEENVLQKIGNHNDSLDFYSDKVYVIKGSNNVKNYFVYGYLNTDIAKQNGKKQKYNFIVREDENNNSFSIAPYGELFTDYIKYNEDSVELKDKFDVEKIFKSIDSNIYNIIDNSTFDDEYIAKNYLNMYLTDATYFKQDAYNLLDSEYKQKRFSTFEKYIEYLNENKDYWGSTLLNKFKKIQDENATKYVILDNYGKYYIFNINAPMQYTVMLDTYTIPLDEILKKYNSSNTSEKVAMCVDIFFNMINNQDYEGAYNKLDIDFRNNYFKNIDDFKNYIKKDFYINNKATYSNFKEIEEIYYTIDVTYYNSALYEIMQFNNIEERQKTFIIDLKGNMNFVMSFNVQ